MTWKKKKKFYKRKPFWNDRNYDDPAYKKWRSDVLKRDGFKCQFPKCNCKKRLNVHHIRTWAKHPAIRFNIMNGITLCYKHHRLVWGKEEEYELLFTRFLVNKIQAKRKL